MSGTRRRELVGIGYQTQVFRNGKVFRVAPGWDVWLVRCEAKSEMRRRQHIEAGNEGTYFWESASENKGEGNRRRKRQEGGEKPQRQQGRVSG